MARAWIRLTSLTEEERCYAEENHGVLLKAMKSLRVPADEYDLAALAYLRAVKKWFACPELRRFPFSRIAYQTIRGEIGNEMRKQQRRIQTVSLDAPIPGTDRLTLMDTICYRQKEESPEVKIDYDIKIPEAAKLGRTPSVEIETLVNFLDSGHRTMALSYDTAKTASSKAGAIRHWIKTNKKIEMVRVYKMDTVIYIEKIIKRGPKPKEDTK